MSEVETAVELAAAAARALKPRPAMTPAVAAMVEKRDDEPLPIAVRNAAMIINDYFSTRGITTYELGPVCSRNHAITLHRLKDILKS